MSAAFLGTGLHRLVIRVVAAERLFIWRQNVNAPFEPAGIAAGHRVACSTVNDSGVRQMVGVHMVLETIQIEILTSVV